MKAMRHSLEGISLVWWPTLLRNSYTETTRSSNFNGDHNNFTTALQSLANVLSAADAVDIDEEVTLP
jgi:hypothetical protein